MPDSDRVLAQAEALLRRVSPEGRRVAQRARGRRWAMLARRFRITVMAILAIVLATAVAGAILPVGVNVLLAAVLAMAVAAFVIFSWPEKAAPTPQVLASSDMKSLPQRTGQWLERQRPALPAPAARLIDDIGIRLETIAPRIAALDPRTPEAVAARKLMAEELPELIEGYARVPEVLRREARHGQSPDAYLVDGLAVVDAALARMTAQLANADLDRLATQGRYLEIKYRGE